MAELPRVSVYSPDRVQGISELVRSSDYEIDPVAVADAMVRRMVWHEVPDVLSLPADREPEPQPTRLRALVRVRRLATPSPLAPRTALRA